MKCIYCHGDMVRIKTYYATDEYDFDEILYRCEDCNAECSYSLPYGYEWDVK